MSIDPYVRPSVGTFVGPRVVPSIHPSFRSSFRQSVRSSFSTVRRPIHPSGGILVVPLVRWSFRRYFPAVLPGGLSVIPPVRLSSRQHVERPVSTSVVPSGTLVVPLSVRRYAGAFVRSSIRKGKSLERRSTRHKTKTKQKQSTTVPPTHTPPHHIKKGEAIAKQATNLGRTHTPHAHCRSFMDRARKKRNIKRKRANITEGKN